MLSWMCTLFALYEEAFDGLNTEDQALYVRLLEWEDPDLFAWFMDHQEPADAEFKTR